MSTICGTILVAALAAFGAGGVRRRADGKAVLLAANLTDRPQRVEYWVYGKKGESAEMQLRPFEISERGMGQ